MAKAKTGTGGYHILLTGGAGFLGINIIKELLDVHSPLEVKQLVVFDLEPPKGISDVRVSYVMGDVRDRDLLMESTRGMDIVLHSAAIVDWGTRSESEIMEVNYGGTRNVVDACRENGVKAMVFTSSLDVLFDGSQLIGVDEDTPYPERHSTSYCRSKYQSELIVIEANSPAFKTCIMRPSDIYGEGDPYHIGSLISMARGGFYVRLGDGTSKCQHVYVGNIAYAHVLAASALLTGNGKVCGKAYFITDAPGSNFFKFFDSIVEASGYRIWPKNIWLPRSFAYFLGSLSELFAKLVRPIKKYTPKMSRFAVTYTCTTYTFTSDRARSDFGFVPKYSPEESFSRTVSYYRQPDRDQASAM